jgi:hypothetical protein
VYVEQVRYAAAHWYVCLLWLTPAEAQRLLDRHNHSNRPLSAAWRKLVEKIVCGTWMLNGDTIVFGSNGHLLNGQHRLAAIAAGDTPVPVFAVYNVDPAAFVTFDQGKRRNGADVLSILDYENCTTLTSALVWAQRHAEGQLHALGARSIPNEVIGDVAASYPELPASVRLVKGRWRKDRLFPPGLLAFLHYELTRRNPEAAAEFFERVVDGVGVERDSHEFLLRRRLETDLSGRRATGEQVEIAALAIKTWNNIRLNRAPGKNIQWKRATNEPFPKFA